MELSDIIASSKHDDIEHLLNALHEAAREGNARKYFGCFLPQSTFLGTDKTEHWTIQQFFSQYKAYFTGNGPAWVYTYIAGTRKINMFTNDSSRICFATFDELLTSKDFGATARGSGTVQLIDGHWYICAYHLTFPIPNSIARDACKRIEMAEQASEFQQKTKDADSAAAALLAELELEESHNSEPRNDSSKGKKHGGKKKK